MSTFGQAGRVDDRDQLARQRAAADDQDARVGRVRRAGSRRRTARSGDAGTAFVDEAPGRLGGDAGVAAVGVGADGRAELLVERRAADQDDVVVAHPALS